MCFAVLSYHNLVVVYNCKIHFVWQHSATIFIIVLNGVENWSLLMKLARNLSWPLELLLAKSIWYAYCTYEGDQSCQNFLLATTYVRICSTISKCRYYVHTYMFYNFQVPVYHLKTRCYIISTTVHLFIFMNVYKMSLE